MAARKRIQSLTAEQVALMAEYRDRWTAIGLSTVPADRPRAEAAIRLAYQAGAVPVPSRIVWCQSPLSQGLTRALVLDLVKAAPASVWASVWASVRDSVWDSVRDSVGDSVRASVGDSVRDSVWDSVGDSVWASVWASVRDSVWASVRDSVGDSGYGQHDASWLAFYRYFHDACGLTAETEKLHGMWELAESAGWWLPHAGLCWVSERPNRLCRDERGRLHSADGMAVRYPDGWGVYALHGVRVPAYVVETPAEQLEPKLLLKEQNAEVRRELVRKIGIERVCAGLGAKVIDRAGDMYELLMLNLGDGRRRPYLKMLNPSIGVYHIEGVHPHCDTVEKALNFRNGTGVSPAVLT